jgi:hypothetical protein
MALTYLAWKGEFDSHKTFGSFHSELAQALHFDEGEAVLSPGECRWCANQPCCDGWVACGGADSVHW